MACKHRKIIKGQVNILRLIRCIFGVNTHHVHIFLWLICWILQDISLCCQDRLMSEGEANMIMLSKVKELIQNIEAPIGKQTSNTWLLTSWLKCHKFLSLLYIDFFVTGTGTLCFLAYSIASSLPVISHSLQGATTFNSGFRAKNVSSKRTWSNKYTSEIHIKDCV